MAEEKTLRDEALASEDYGHAEFYHRGRRYLVKPPTLAQQKQAKLAAKMKDGEDVTRMGILLLIHCVVDPDTGKPVLTRADEEALCNQPSTSRSFVGKALKAFAELSEQTERAEGFFDEAAGDSSSTQ